MQMNQPKGVKRKMREHKLRNRVNWQKTLKQKAQNQTDVKQGFGVVF